MRALLAAGFSPERRAVAEALGADIVVDPGAESRHARREGLRFTPSPASLLLEVSLCDSAAEVPAGG